MSVLAYLKDVPLSVRLEAVKRLTLLGEDPGPLMDAAFEPGDASAVLTEELPPISLFCKHGHEFTPSNTYYAPDGRRYCRACNRERGIRHARKRGVHEAPTKACKQGHPWTPESTAICSTTGRRRCRICRLEGERRRRQQAA